MTCFRFSHWKFDVNSGTLTDTQTQVSQVLRFQVAKLLTYFLTHPHQILSKDTLLDALWQHGEFRENSLAQGVREIRKMLGDDPKQPSFVQTHKQRGYEWICGVTCEDNEDAKLQPVNSTEASKKKSPRKIGIPPLLGLLVIVVGLIAWLLLGIGQSSQHISPNARVMILPFADETREPTMAWLEWGLSDMVSGQLSDASEMRVISPVVANRILLEQGMSWPVLPSQLRQLMKKEDIDFAVIAEVSLKDDQQIMRFRILAPDDKTLQGTLAYSSLPVAIPQIAEQWRLLMLGEQRGFQQMVSLSVDDDEKLAMELLAKGMQAIHTQGPVAAKRYLRAASSLAPNNPWIGVHLAQANILSGHWEDADALLDTYSTSSISESLKLTFDYWRAELAFRRGDYQTVIALLSPTSQVGAGQKDLILVGKHLRLLAKVAWENQEWQKHQALLQKADALSPHTADLAELAERTFYLGVAVNKGVEKQVNQALDEKRIKLEAALNYYRQLHNQPMVAATLLGLAQNYTLPVKQREQYLSESIALYQHISHPFEQAQALSYQGFMLIQQHQGKQALSVLEKAKEIAAKIGAARLQETLDFYIGFAHLDAGLDQRFAGRHHGDRQHLEIAVSHLSQLADQSSTPFISSNSDFMLGWAYTGLQDYEQAHFHLLKAEKAFSTLDMPASIAYSNFSLMFLQLKSGDIDQILALDPSNFSTKKEHQYYARAWYEKGDFSQAEQTLLDVKQTLPELWSTDDEKKLEHYRRAKAEGKELVLDAESPSYEMYCESDWLLEAG